MLCAGGEGKGGCQVSVNTVSFTSEVYKLVCLSVCPALCSVHLSVYRFVYLTVCVFLSVQFVNGLCQTCRVRNNLTRVYYGHNATLWSLCIQYFFFSKREKNACKIFVTWQQNLAPSDSLYKFKTWCSAEFYVSNKFKTGDKYRISCISCFPLKSQTLNFGNDFCAVIDRFACWSPFSVTSATRIKTTTTFPSLNSVLRIRLSICFFRWFDASNVLRSFALFVLLLSSF